ASADFAKCIFSERKFPGPQCRLVKLHRPPPEIRIFRPTCPLCSSNATRRPRCPATAAHISPAAPAPKTITSNWRGASVIAPVQKSGRGPPIHILIKGIPAKLQEAVPPLFPKSDPASLSPPATPQPVESPQ